MSSVKVNCYDHFSTLISFGLHICILGKFYYNYFLQSGKLLTTPAAQLLKSETWQETGQLILSIGCPKLPQKWWELWPLIFHRKNPQDDVLSTRNCVVPMIPKSWNTPTSQGQPGASRNLSRNTGRRCWLTGFDGLFLAFVRVLKNQLAFRH